MLILYLPLREGQTYNVVIIAKRIHLFPYRTQKLSSLAAMVLGGQPPGRVARSHVVCRSGGTGRRTGLKILRDLPLVPVRFRSSAPFFTINIAGWSSWQLVGLITRRSQVRVLPPQPNKYGPLVKRSRHRPFTAVTGVRFPYGSPLSWDYSSAGRAPALQAGGHRFEPC